MNEQVQLIEEALRRARGASLGALPLDIAVARPYGDSTVTLRTQLPAKGGSQSVPQSGAAGLSAAAIADHAAAQAEAAEKAGVKRTMTSMSFFEGGRHPNAGVERRDTGASYDREEGTVAALMTEIERLKRKALSRGVNLTSPLEDVPAEDVAMLKQVFMLADTSGDGLIGYEELKNLHYVLGEPLTDEETTTAFKAMDINKSGSITFDDFLAWYTLAHSTSGMLSKKGQAYTLRFKKIMSHFEGQFDVKNLTTMIAGQPKSLEFRVQFHYNDRGQLKQISPWHDIPLYTTDGHLHLITEIPKFSRAKFEIATGEEFNPIKQDTKNGKLREYKYGDMLFNYGAFPQTWEDPNHNSPDTGFKGDNDPIDACEIGVARLRTGSVTRVKVLGVLGMIDDGETDWKVICINVDDVMAPRLNDIDDVEREMPGIIDVMREWLRMYKTVDGKPENVFALEERAMNRDYALGVIQETHQFWKSLTQGGRTTV